MRKRRVLVFLLAAVMVMLSACSVNTGDAPKQKEGSEVSDDSGKGDDKENKKGEKSKKVKKKTLKDSAKKDDAESIRFSFVDNPCELKDGSTVLATGNYYTFELPDKESEDYPELAAFLADHNNKSKDDLMLFFGTAEQDVPEMIKDGMETGYEADAFLHLLRSDGDAFSFVEEIWYFYGGAHGTTGYTGYHIDPATGEDIPFDDVVSDTSKLPDIVMTELIRQNDDLEEYFENDEAGKRDLEKGLPDRFADNASGIAWGLSYEGIELFFEDYAMGSYAAGTRSVVIRFEDYPEVFTDKYNRYAGSKDMPDINKVAKDEGSVETQELVPSFFVADEHVTGGGDAVEITKDMQKKMNIFISNFVEQGFQSYDYGHPDIEEVATFAYRWTRINKPDDVKLDGGYYKISFDQIKKLADKYLGLKVTEDDLGELSGETKYGGFYKNGYYCEPAADGEYHTSFAVVDSAENVGEGMLRLNFTAYSMDLDAFWDNNEEIPKKYYSFNSADAGREKTLEEWAEGYAIVRSDGDSYKLNYYEMY